jgi:predicted nucleotidyltransferase
MKYGLSLDNIAKINAIFERYPQIDEILIYGSRAKGDFRYNSDIDLTIKGEDLDINLLHAIKDELDNLMLPYTIDISIYNEIDNLSLKEHIDRVAKIFFERSYSPSSSILNNT